MSEVENPHTELSDNDDALTLEQADDLALLAKAGELEVPAGADDLAAALVLIAAQRDGSIEQLKRTAADLQNFQRRARIQATEAREQAVRGVVSSLLMSLDTFDLALTQDPATVNAEQVFDGVRAIKGEILRQLGQHGVVAVEPGSGDEFEPGKHEAVMHEPTDAAEPGTVARTLQIGYAMGERVIRPAKIALAAAAAPAAEEEAPDADL
ncbi:MAG: nucleotide exchange factor GrpE [Planctomycetota bacterium]